MTSKRTLFCSECGATAEAPCDCGAAYVPAGVAAAKGVAEFWELSDRAIGKKIGVSYSTVREARLKLATGGNPSVDRRIGLDGRSRRLPQRGYAITPAELAHLPEAVELVENLTPIMEALKKEGNCHVMAMSPSRVGQLAHEARNLINESLPPISQAKACERCAAEWKIDGTKLNENVMDAVRGAADAWNALLAKLELIYSTHEESSAIKADIADGDHADDIKPQLH
jgi:hypothetical protein